MAVSDQRSRAVRVVRVAATGLAAVGLVSLVTLAVDAGGVRERLFGRRQMLVIDSLAVLPLANLSGDSSQEYFVEGIHEALIAGLGQLTGLKRVIARGSVARLAGRKTSLREIAEQLRVAALITGDVLRSADRVRVTVRLVSPLTEAQMWARSYERDIGGALLLERDIVAAIAREIRVQLTPQERKRLRSARRIRPGTYESYLKGMSALRKKTPEGCAEGLEVLQHAAANDPSDPLPYAGVASAYPRRSPAPARRWADRRRAQRRVRRLDCAELTSPRHRSSGSPSRAARSQVVGTCLSPGRGDSPSGSRRGTPAATADTPRSRL